MRRRQPVASTEAPMAVVRPEPKAWALVLQQAAYRERRRLQFFAADCLAIPARRAVRNLPELCLRDRGLHDRGRQAETPGAVRWILDRRLRMLRPNSES